MEEKYKLVPWSELSPEALKIIIANEAKNNKGTYIKPEDYEKSSFYVDKDGRVARGKDVDNWRWSSEAERQKMLQEDPDFFENLWHRIDETYGTGNPIWGSLRVINANKAKPNFMDNFQLLQNVGDVVNMASAGWINRLSPSLNIGLGIDLLKGKDVSKSWFGNSGVVSDEFAQEHPVASAVVNGAADIAAVKGLQYGLEPIEIRTGTETPLVETRRLSPTVTKHTHIPPAEEHIRRASGLLEADYIGRDSNGLYTYKQAKAWMPKNPRRAFNLIVKQYKDKGYEVITHPNLQGIGLQNNKIGRVISDLGNHGEGLVGWVFDRIIPRPVIVDAAILPKGEFYLDMMKKGGRLIPRAYGGFKTPSDNTTNNTVDSRVVGARIEDTRLQRFLREATRQKLARSRKVPAASITEEEIDSFLNPLPTSIQPTISATTSQLELRRQSGLIKTQALKKVEEERAKDMATMYNNFGLTIGRPLINLNFAALHPEWVLAKTNEAAHLLPDAFATGVAEGLVAEAPALLNAVKSSGTARKLAKDVLAAEILSQTANEAYKGITGSENGYMADALSPITSKIESPYAKEAVGFVGGLVDPAFYMGPSVVDKGVDLSRVAIDKTGKMVAPYLIAPQIKGPSFKPQEPLLNVGWGPKQTLSVSHKSNSPEPLKLFNTERWDVVNEDANPFGIWWLGKFGVPRTAEAGATPNKVAKAEKARALFANRPYTHEGELTLDKPIVTVGDVPNRSALSYEAEKMGADGVIYNNVYDNGYDKNLVILGFKYPKNNIIKQKVSYSMLEPSDLDLIEIEKWLSENPDALNGVGLMTPETIPDEAIDRELSDKLNKIALDYYSSEVYPRLAYTPKRDIETREFYLEPSENIASPELFNKYNRPIKVVDDVTMIKLGLLGNNGVHYNDGHNIVWSKSPDPELSGIHETLHGKDDILEPLVYPYFSKMHDNLVNVYAIKEAENRLLTKYGEEYLNNLSDEEYYKLGDLELANIGLEINRIFKNIGVASAENGKSMEELRALLKKRNLNIDDLSDSQLIGLYEPINGYTTQYTKMLRLENPTGIDSYYNLGEAKTGSYSYIKGSPTYKMYGSNEFVNRLRFAVKYLPVLGAVVAGSQMAQPESQKQGGRLIPRKKYGNT